MATLDQDRAKLAFEHVTLVSGWATAEQKKKYASIVQAMPALIRSAGLSQALHFVLSRRRARRKAIGRSASSTSSRRSSRASTTRESRTETRSSKKCEAPTSRATSGPDAGGAGVRHLVLPFRAGRARDRAGDTHVRDHE